MVFPRRVGAAGTALLLIGVVLPGSEAVPKPQDRKPEDRQYVDQIRPFLTRHCQECHGGEKPKGDFRLDELDPRFATKAAEDRWSAVREQLQSGEMPPRKKPRPPENDVRAVSDWIGGRMAAAQAARRGAQGRVVLRRLNRVEYENTVRDLLDVEVDLKEALPFDGSMDGFDNVGEALHLSSYALERYLEAADRALNAAIANHPRPPTVKKRLSLKDAKELKSRKESAFRVTGETVVCFASDEWERIKIPFMPPHRGLYRYRITASAVQSSGKPVAFQVSEGTRGNPGLLWYYEVPADKPTVIEFALQGAPKESTQVSILPYALARSKSVTRAGGGDPYTGPGLAVHEVEVEGPLYDGWPPASHRRIFGDLPQAPAKEGRLEVVSKNPLADAETILRAFARRAFRRAVTEDDLKPLVALVRARLEEKDSFEQAVRVALSRVMLSREFLFLSEKPGALDDFALAGRLSYFLWSSMPDEELLALAEQKRLGQPDALRQQVERMLRSPKAAAFASNFCGQWLGLREIDSTAPSPRLYPEFDQMLKLSMVKETELFFSEILKDDLSVVNFISSDFSILNGRLARHYGLPGGQGLWEFRKVALPPESHRGGVLTMASVLKVTANGTTTSPITRGAWVLDRILGTPPPMPPPDVPALEPDIRGATTIRDQLAKHRTDPACSACHAKIDPPGFALENFDVIGGWREQYRSVSSKGGAKVDPSGELASGARFKDIDEFKQLLLKDKDQIARALTRMLTTYATGGAPEESDQPEIEAVVVKVRAKNYGFRSLVHEIVQSRMFRNK